MKLQIAVAAISLCATGVMAQPVDRLPSQIETKVRERMVGLLKDPYSAEILVTKGPWSDEVTVFGRPLRAQFICAKVNAKNGYGAYIGFRPYMFTVNEDGEVGVWQRGSMPETDAIQDRQCGPGPAV